MTTAAEMTTDEPARVLSARTRAAYAGDWALFTDHCTVTDRPALPADPRTVVDFLSAGAGLSRSSAHFVTTTRPSLPASVSNVLGGRRVMSAGAVFLVGMLVLIAGVAMTQVLAVVGVIVGVAGVSVMTVVAGSFVHGRLLTRRGTWSYPVNGWGPAPRFESRITGIDGAFLPSIGTPFRVGHGGALGGTLFELDGRQ